MAFHRDHLTSPYLCVMVSVFPDSHQHLEISILEILSWGRGITLLI